MNIIFYSNKCNYCIKILNYLNTSNYKSLFKLINIDSDNNLSVEITDLIDKENVPILINPNLNQILKGNEIYEYITNIKYFNISTNNVENIIPNNPDIIEDNKAISKDNINLLLINLELNKQDIKSQTQEIVPIKKFKFYHIKK